MSESLANLAASPSLDLPTNFPPIPKCELATLGAVEEMIERTHLRKAAAAGIGLRSDVADRLIANATSDVVLSRLKFGFPGFFHLVTSKSQLPFFLQSLLSQNDPSFTMDKATALLKTLDGTHFEKVQATVAEAFGFDMSHILRPKKDEPKNEQAGASPAIP